ncbi:MAG: TetR family transcriptional regulator, partial [Nitrospinaceae bacterium]|nr:TetR/AcrR family transcriptional regulator [Nitrospinaceae bacterium]NIR53277.1 TetR/AcrR family transcriptional regulator [Nitrospinaceae bacterium]NIS83676.1 TetR/AcrR family transcriptional regulator [Nitrospinaceae bacterium]NIT80472.1 TetR/AcrR family transcriptional regulator [Nitrospinaceae bacterium]NIU42802.1 TetR/AcrR family transcriptional regulator [Nitrospinaceae bacterium]
MKTAEFTTDQIQNLILDKAVDRFGQYGFGKTTMAEIALDCGMSAGNLYRYFENKREIGIGCAQRFIGRAETLLRTILKRTDLTPAQRLETFFLEKLRFTYNQIFDQPKIHELVLYIYDERWDLVIHHVEVQYSFLSEILAEGKQKGEFDLAEVLETAKILHAATTKFHDPNCMKGYSL